jgi:tetraacyldisaccharide 4'-kinase
VAVVVGADRHAAGLEALRRLAARPDLFLLDDGFSHLALRRDLDLVAFPAADPFGGGRLFPSGRLREPLAAVSRADAVILTGAAPADLDLGAGLAAALRSRGFTGPGFASVTRPGAPVWTGAGTSGGVLAPGTRVFLATAIARPELFAATARGLGLDVAGELHFPDHHAYPQASLDRLTAAWRASGAAGVLTTAKDRVKLAGRIDLPLAELPIRADPEPAFWEWLDDAVARIREKIS